VVGLAGLALQNCQLDAESTLFLFFDESVMGFLDEASPGLTARNVAKGLFSLTAVVSRSVAPTSSAIA
jgi:hypothetical protein